jgi:hypothetical protein
MCDVKAKLLEEDFNNAFKMMTHLKQLYEPSTDTEFFMLMRELLSLRYADFDTTELYLSHPEWAKREASATATANVAIAKDAGISFGTPRGNALTWGAAFHL